MELLLILFPDNFDEGRFIAKHYEINHTEVDIELNLSVHCTRWLCNLSPKNIWETWWFLGVFFFNLGQFFYSLLKHRWNHVTSARVLTCYLIKKSWSKTCHQRLTELDLSEANWYLARVMAPITNLFINKSWDNFEVIIPHFWIYPFMIFISILSTCSLFIQL